MTLRNKIEKYQYTIQYIIRYYNQLKMWEKIIENTNVKNLNINLNNSLNLILKTYTTIYRF